MFQSLTGSIHTSARFLSEGIYGLFQSLTGSIHTYMTFIVEQSPGFVSIPHRFNSHFKIILMNFLSLKSFNPSQVQFTLNMEMEMVACWAVSIPHRFNSHLIKSAMATCTAVTFQSLTGSIHTF